jgi:hypothetical protein
MAAVERQHARAVVLGCLGGAAVFEVLTVVATQDKAIRAVSPWQDDPYDAVVSLAQLTVPMLGLVIALRLLAWRAPGGPDRVRQTVRAAGTMTALVGLTLAFEWAALALREHAPSWNGRTGALVGGLAASTALTAVLAVLLIRYRSPRGPAWRHDWLGDVAYLCRWVPLLRRAATPAAEAWVRRRAMTVFVAVSLFAAAGTVGALAVGEGWTDPLLIAWAVAVVATADLAFCLISNAVAGFVARPERTPRRRVIEAAVLAGCVAIQVATAFRDALWPGSVTSVPLLVALTMGAGIGTSLVTGGLLVSRNHVSRNHVSGNH